MSKQTYITEWNIILIQKLSSQWMSINLYINLCLAFTLTNFNWSYLRIASVHPSFYLGLAHDWVNPWRTKGYFHSFPVPTVPFFHLPKWDKFENHHKRFNRKIFENSGLPKCVSNFGFGKATDWKIITCEV